MKFLYGMFSKSKNTRAKKTSGSNQESNKNKMALNQKIKLAAEVATIGVFLVAAYSTWITWESIEQTNKRADSSITISWNTMMYTLRPYLMINDIQPRRITDTGTYNIMFYIKNTGQTPAYVLETLPTRAEFKFGNQIWEDEIEKVKKLDVGTRQAEFLGGGEIDTFNVAVVGVRTKPILGDTAIPPMFLWGKLVYRDNFKINHIRIFGYTFSFITQQWSPHKYNFEYEEK